MVNKRLYVFDAQQRPLELTIRNYCREDFAMLIDIQRECFPPPFPPELWWKEEQLENHVRLFPEGALCAEIGGRLVGSMTGLIVSLEPDEPDRLLHTWAEITDNGYIGNHDPQGNTLYIVDISVRPDSRQLGIGKWMMQTMYELVVHRGLHRLLGGARMSGYRRFASQMSAEQYVDAVLSGRERDPVISFLLRCGRTPVAVVPDYLEDEESLHYGLLMEWKNPFIEVPPLQKGRREKGQSG